MSGRLQGLAIRVQPGAKKDAVELAADGSVKIRLRAPAVDGKANTALVRFLTDALDVSAGDVCIRSGEHSRNKVIQIRGWEAEVFRQRLSAVAAAPQK